MRRLLCSALVAGTFVATGAALPTTAYAQESDSDAAPAAIPQGCSQHGSIEVCLTDPTAASDGRDRLLEERLREMVQGAGEGDLIRVAMYTWTRPGLAEDLVAAQDRGVDVRVVLDGVNEQDNNEPYQVLKEGEVPLTNCSDSCLGSNINHTKYFLFDVGGTKSVVVTSSNMTTSQTELFNNMVKVDDDEQLYGFVMGFWDRMNAQSWTYDGVTWGDDDKTVEGDGNTAGYAYPRKGDNVLWMLDGVTECSDDADGDGDPDNRVWVSASMFTSPRAAIRDRLKELEGMGCDVKVIVGDADTESWVEASGLEPANVGVVEASHNKLLVIDAKYQDNWDQVVFTGSHNLTGTSLETNDEVIVRITDAEIGKLYQDYFTGMFDIASGT